MGITAVKPAELVLAMKRLARVSASVLWAAQAEFREKRLFRDSAFLAYFAILSTIPFLSLLTWLARLVARPLLNQPRLLQRFQEDILVSTDQVFPFLAGEVEAVLRQVVAYPDSAGLVGLGAMFITAGFLFSALSVSISEAYGLEKPRGFWGVRVVSAIVLISTVMLLFALMGLRRLLATWLADDAVGNSLLLVRGAWGTLFQAAVFTLGFLATVRFSTRGRMRNRPLLIGGLLFWLSWELAVWVFGLYLQHIPTLSVIYGSLTTAAVILLWLYYSSVMFLFSVCVSAETWRRMFPPAADVDKAPEVG